jgi:hypothetical protein
VQTALSSLFVLRAPQATIHFFQASQPPRASSLCETAASLDQRLIYHLHLLFQAGQVDDLGQVTITL